MQYQVHFFGGISKPFWAECAGKCMKIYSLKRVQLRQPYLNELRDFFSKFLHIREVSWRVEITEEANYGIPLGLLRRFATCLVCGASVKCYF